ncbi:MAG TPA: exosortase family protein XrtF [Salinimicrobium sp.]|nr:exosortase family protein XrtF [Salinimicrobium sp.]
MRKLFLENKAVFQFVFTFSGSYILLVILYSVYLKFASSEIFYPDYITHAVAVQSEMVINSLGYSAEVIPHTTEPSMKLIVDDVFVARIIEGCNAVSVILLFIAFIVSFFGKFKPTLLYILAGSVLIYATNIARIAILSIGIYEYPEKAEFLHGTVFPGIIYGMVFMLWVLWIIRFSKVKK